MKNIYKLLTDNHLFRSASKEFLLSGFLLVFFSIISVNASGQVIYNHNFGTASISTHPYTVSPLLTPTPGAMDANLSASSWTNSTGTWGSAVGNGGSPSQALWLGNSGGTPTISLSLTIAAGYLANITAFEFWRQRSTAGATNWSMTINGIAVGAGTFTTGGGTIPLTTVSNAVNNLSGTINVVLSLSGASGTGTVRLDDFKLYGTVVMGATMSANSITGFGDICTGTTTGANTFTLSGTNLTASNLTVGPLTGYSFSIDNATYAASRTFSMPGTQDKLIYARFSPTLVQSYAGNIPISGGGASAITVPVTGNGVNTMPVVSNGTVSGITTSDATISAIISSTGCTALTGYGIEYSTTPGFANGTGTVVPSSNLLGGNYSVTLTGLVPPGQIFYFHTYATNGGGTSYGTEASFILNSLTPLLTVPAAGAGSLGNFGSVCVNTASTLSFNLSGSLLNGSAITVGPLAGYSFATSVAGVYSNTITLTTAGTDYSYSAGILSGCTIYVKLIPTLVQSYNGVIPVAGGGAPSINVNAAGSGINTTPTVTTDAAVFITTTTATLPATLTVPGCGVLFDYGIEYSNAPFLPGSGTPVSSSNLGGNSFSVNLASLTPNTTYYYYAYAVNSGGTVYGASSNFTTIAVPSKLVILSVTPASPTALTSFSITVQAQDNAGNPVDVSAETDIQLSQAAGSGFFSFPNSPLPAGTLFDGTNTTIINDISYNLVENNVAITASAVSGMTGLTASLPIVFNVVAYTGPNTFIWSDVDGSAWVNGANWQGGTAPGSTTTPVANLHLASFTDLANLNLSGVGGIGVNMNTGSSGASQVLNVGAIYFTPAYNFTHVGDIVYLGNSSTTLSGTLYLYGTNVNNVGGNNYSNLLIANYMGNATTKTFEIRNTQGSGNKLLTLNFVNAGSIVAGPGRTINLHTYMTGSQPLTFTGGGNFSIMPTGVSTVNTFTGAINVANGTLLAGSTGAFSAVTPNVVTLGSSANAGILRLNGNSVTIGALATSGTAGIANKVDNGFASATLTVNGTSSTTFSGAINNGSSGILTLVKTGTSTLNLTGFNQYTGLTTINNGTLRLNYTGGGTIPSGNSITVSGGSAVLRISTDQTISNLTISSGTLIVDAGVTLTVTGNYTTGPGGFFIQNNGTIRLQGAAPQAFPGTTAIVSSMNNLTINNASGVSMNKNLNIAGVLTLQNGTFTVGAYTLTINNPVAGTVNNLSANNISSITIAGTAAGVNLPASVSQLNNLTVSNTQGTTLQGNLNVGGTLFITATAGTVDADFDITLNGNGNLIMNGGNLRLAKNGVVLPELSGAYSLTGGTVTFNGVGIGSDAQTVRPVNYFNLTSNPTGGDRILSSTGVIGIANVFTPSTNNYTVTGSTVDFNKPAGQNIPAFTFYNLRISGGSAVLKTLTGNIGIKAAFTIAPNTRFSLAAFDATLKSDATGTANVDIIPTANSIIYGGTGRFVVERYIPTAVSHGKSWQLLATPSFGQSLKDSWQEGNGPLAYTTPLLGTTITSDKAGAVARGYDFYTPAGGPSIKTYNPATNTWVGIDDGSTSTSSLPIANKKGYMIFVRGDRSVQTSAAAATVTTLRTRGKIYAIGADAPPSTTVAAGKLETVGNPYASSIDFVNLLGTSTGIDTKYYVWDPLLPSFYGYGAYQTISSATGYKPVPGGTANYDEDSVYTRIQSGQAFFVYSTTGGTVNFTEGNKAAGSRMAFRPFNSNERQSLRVNLFGMSGALADGNVIVFSREYSNSYESNDAVKIDNFGENIGIRSNGKILAVEARYPVISADTIFYNLANLRVQDYQLTFEPENLATGLLEAYFVDKFLGTKTAFNLSGNTTFSFSITADPASKAADRFYVIFQPTRPVPVQHIDITATLNRDNTVALNWKVTNEAGMAMYVAERSKDGRVFSPIGSVAPVNNNGGDPAYLLNDDEPFTGDIFYRIRAVSQNGTTQYSRIVQLTRKNEQPGFSIQPNPVVDRIIRLALTNMATGKYAVQLTNNLGQVVFQQSIMVNQANATIVLPVEKLIPAGYYRLTMRGGPLLVTKELIIK